jgi:hypothetical protein
VRGYGFWGSPINSLPFGPQAVTVIRQRAIAGSTGEKKRIIPPPKPKKLREHKHSRDNQGSRSFFKQKCTCLCRLEVPKEMRKSISKVSEHQGVADFAEK